MNIFMILFCFFSCEFGYDECGDGLYVLLQKDNYVIIDGEQVKVRREVCIEYIGICILCEEINFFF